MSALLCSTTFDFTLLDEGIHLVGAPTPRAATVQALARCA
jgi:hypothetical protein